MKESVSCCRPVLMLFLVALRVAIGWHLLYEGLHKLETQKTDHPWSAAAYLENSRGPFAEHFRRLLRDDSPGEELVLDAAALERQWAAFSAQFSVHYMLTDEQKTHVDTALTELGKLVQEEFFDDPQIRGVIQQFLADREHQQSEQFLTTSEQKRSGDNERLLRDRVGEWTERFRNRLAELLTPEQREQPPVPERIGRIEQIDLLVIWGQIIGGGCLLVGLFSRLASLGGAAMLLLFYLSMPPFPGLPATTMGAGHYLYVNENLIEALALLALSTTGSGRWAGLDAMVRALITRPFFGVGRSRSD